MPSLRLLQHWPWGCVLSKSEVPLGNFEFYPNSNHYWATTNLTQAMSWYYRVKKWKFSFFIKDGLDIPVSSEAEGDFSFSSELDVVCSDRRAVEINASTTSFDLSGIPTIANGRCVIFSTATESIQPTNLLTQHSVVLDGGLYAVFCKVSISLQFPTDGLTMFQSANSGVLSTTADLELGGEKYFEATSNFFGYRADVKIEPQEFFSFS